MLRVDVDATNDERLSTRVDASACRPIDSASGHVRRLGRPHAGMSLKPNPPWSILENSALKDDATLDRQCSNRFLDWPIGEVTDERKCWLVRLISRAAGVGTTSGLPVPNAAEHDSGTSSRLLLVLPP